MIVSYLKESQAEEWFDLIIGGEDVSRHKPHPEGLLLAIEQLQATPSKTLYIGDSTVDAETAAAANIDFVGVTNGITTDKELKVYPHKKIVDNLTGVLK